MKKRVSLGIAAITLVGITSFGSFAFAAGDLAQRQADLAQQAATAQQALYGVNDRMSAVQREITNIEVNLLEVIEELDAITSQLDITRETLYQTSNDLEQAIELRREQQERLVSRARVMYMNGPTTYLDVLLTATDFTDLLMRMEFVNRLIEHDQNLVSDLLETEELIERSYQTILIEEQRLMALELQESTRLNQYETAMAQHSAVLAEMTEQERFYTQLMWNIERDTREVERLIQAANRAARATSGPSTNRIIVDVSNLNGRMAWPVPSSSRVTSPYGMRRSPISGRNEFHSGIDIGAPNGTNFIAADGGVVTFSGWMNGFGNTIIIDHGDGISTLYAHNSRNTVRVGESVVAGQVIGNIGSTGWSTGPHSHFEVRFNGQHVDPMSFLN